MADHLLGRTLSEEARQVAAYYQQDTGVPDYEGTVCACERTCPPPWQGGSGTGVPPCPNARSWLNCWGAIRSTMQNCPASGRTPATTTEPASPISTSLSRRTRARVWRGPSPRPKPPVNGYYSSQQIAAAALGQQFGELGQEYARTGLSIPNTLEIQAGYRFVVMVNKDVYLRAYVDRRAARSSMRVDLGPVVQ
jgi:hypothetical protein